MKKILILAYDFPPYVSVGGLRPYNWYKYFHEFGVEPIVITRQWSNTYGNGLDYIAPSETKELIIEQTEFGTIYRTPFKPNLSNRLLMKYGENRFRLLRKSISAYYEIAQFLYACGPKKEIYKAAKNYLKENKVDAIIASGEPFVLFHYANQLSKDFSTPWYADYRDPWSQNATLSKSVFFKKIIAKIEKKIIINTKAITTVSEFLKFKIGENCEKKEIHVIPNGFDEQLFQKNNLQKNDGLLKIKFAGTIYPWHPWKNVLKELLFWKENNSINFELNFIGINNQNEVENYIQDHLNGLKENIIFTGKVQNDVLITLLGEANLLLLFNDYSILGTKIYDYLGVKRKIILCYGADHEALKLKTKFYNIEEIDGISKQLQTDLLLKTNSGIVVNHASEMQNVLNELWHEFESTGKIACPSHGIENYSRKIQVKKLAEILDFKI
jgi:hypothetical protein